MTSNKGNKRFLFIILVIIIFFSGFCIIQLYPYEKQLVPRAQNGVLDLRNWDFSTNGVIKLNGDWEFYWGQLLGPEDFDGKKNIKPSLTGMIEVPGIWTHNVKNKTMPKTGSATYRLKIKNLKKNAIIGIKTESIVQQVRIYVDGTKLIDDIASAKGENGRLTTPGVIFFNSRDGQNEIIIQVVSKASSNSGIVQRIYMGNQNQIESKALFFNVLDWVVFISFIMLAMVHMVFYLSSKVTNSNQRRDSDFLFFVFSLICIIIAFCNTFLGEMIFPKVFYWLPVEISIKMEQLVFFGAMVNSAFFLCNIGKDVLPKRLVGFIKIATASYFIMVLVTPYEISSYLKNVTPIVYITMVYFPILLIMVKSKTGGFRFDRNENLPLVLALIFIAIYGLNMDFYYLGIIDTYSIAYLGLFLFEIAFTAILTRRFVGIYRIMNGMSNKVLEINKLQEDFLVNTANELKKPIIGIINISEALIARDPESLLFHQKYAMDQIISTARRLTYLINDILDFGRINEKDIELEMKRTNVYACVEIVIEVIKYIAEAKNINIQNKVSKNLPFLLVDESRLCQVLYNLIGNSVKYSDDGTVEINASIIEGFLKISIQDEGRGIPPDQQKDLFDLNNRFGYNSNDKSGGVGFGLAISSTLVNKMGGQLWLENSVPGEGSCFALTLKLAEQEVDITNENEIKDFLLDDESTRKFERNNRVGDYEFDLLVIENEVLDLQVLKYIFSEENYLINTVRSGEGALEKLSHGYKPDLVIIDLMLPGISGYETCRQIRKQYSMAELPILLETVNNLPDEIETGLNAGANDFITKPYDSIVIRARVKTLMLLKKSVQALVDSELAFLRAQIKPHFLYNAINTIIYSSRKDVEKTRMLLYNLSDFLRGSFDFTNAEHFVHFSKELKMINAYIAIEEERFGDRLKVDYFIETDEFELPPLVLQPLVENGIRHGILGKIEGGNIQIIVRVSPNNSVIIQVIDDGVGIPEEKLKTIFDIDNRSGVGLANIQARLLKEYGSSLKISSLVGVGTKVEFEIPLGGNE